MKDWNNYQELGLAWEEYIADEKEEFEPDEDYYRNTNNEE